MPRDDFGEPERSLPAIVDDFAFEVDDEGSCVVTFASQGNQVAVLFLKGQQADTLGRLLTHRIDRIRNRN